MKERAHEADGRRLLASSPRSLLNSPRVGDVDITANILRAVGADIAVE